MLRKKFWSKILICIQLLAIGSITQETANAFAETVITTQCLSPSIVITSKKIKSCYQKFLKEEPTPLPWQIMVNTGTPRLTAKGFPAVIKLKNRKTGEPFELRRFPRTKSSYALFIQGQYIPNSQFTFRETDSAIKTGMGYISGTNYSLTSQGIGTTVLSYLAALAYYRDKDLLIEDTDNYGAVYSAFKYFSPEAMFHADSAKPRPFSRIDWFREFGPIKVDISSPFIWTGEYLPGGKGMFTYTWEDGDEFSSRIVVEEKNGKVIVRWKNPQEEAALKFQVFLRKKVTQISIPIAKKQDKTLHQFYDIVQSI